MVEMFTTIGIGQWFRYVVGALEIFGAIGVLVPRTSGLAAASLLVAVLAWVRYRRLVDRGRLLLRQPDAEPVAASVAPGGLPVGAFLSDFALPTRNGEIVTLPDLLARRLLLLFVQPGCLFSRTLAREMQGVTVSVDAPRPVLIVGGKVNDPESLALVARVPGSDATIAWPLIIPWRWAETPR